MTRTHWIIAGLVGATLLKLCLFTVDVTQMAVRTCFGKPVDTVRAPGLHVKLPWQSRIVFDARLRAYDPPASEFLTADKKNLLVDSYVCWRIGDPVLFLSAVRNDAGAQMRIHDMVWSSVSAAIGKYELSNFLSVDASDIRTSTMMKEVVDQCVQRAARDYGVQIVDVALKRLNFPEQNKQSVFDRMRAERQKMVKQYRAEGESEALRIRAEADRKRTEILAEAYRKAEIVRGEGDASASRLYGQAHNADPEFYRFTRTLDSYKKVLGKGTTAVLSSDSEYLRLLTEGDGAAR